MAFLDDMRDVIVNDTYINATFSPRIYFQLLPINIDKQYKWLRWGFTRTSQIDCIGGGVAQTTYDLFIDVIWKTINDLPDIGDSIVDAIQNKTYNGIVNIKYTNNTYSNYQEKDIYVNSMNFTVTYN